ncbi:acyclic terpene utilization AtuA family protein [Streptomyces sp. M19]
MRRTGHRRQLRVLHRARCAPPRLPARRDLRRRLLRHHQAPGTGGAVTTGTVTAQLLYETQGALRGPDVTARLDTVRLAQEAPDRVRITGVRGEPPPRTSRSA